MMKFAWLIPLFPLISFISYLISNKSKPRRSAYFGIAMVSISVFLSVFALIERLAAETYKAETVWLTMGELTLVAGFEINQLNVLMLVIVSFISLIVHIYSQGYMAEDERFSIYYSYLGLFTFAMLGLVISPNLVQTYIFWELVGLGSFLLIGFFFYKDAAKRAAKKAFIMTRIGDVALLVGIILLFWQVGSVNYSDIFAAVNSGELSEQFITLTALLIFIGAIGKSGQFPLHTWLPDAMEGPTPVSALIHSATMVAAGVYLVAALFPLFTASKTALLVVATVGAVTAIFAASIGLVQQDLKHVLAYSTISQLGYMMLALGSVGYAAGVYHLMSHAFFKALLFLAAGTIIKAVGTQNIMKMGGLWRKLTSTGGLFLIGAIAISGVPLLYGFFSKDKILTAVWNSGHYILFFLATIAAFCTAFYMFRLFFLIFTGTEREDSLRFNSPPITMTRPMFVLATVAIIVSFLNGPAFEKWITAGLPTLSVAPASSPIWIMALATVVSFGGIVIAYLVYIKQSIDRTVIINRYEKSYNLLLNKYYVDEFYELTVIKLVKFISSVLRFIDKFIVEGIIKVIVGTVRFAGTVGSKAQNGQVQLYGTVAFVGLAILIVIYALTGGYFG